MEKENIQNFSRRKCVIVFLLIATFLIAPFNILLRGVYPFDLTFIIFFIIIPLAITSLVAFIKSSAIIANNMTLKYVLGKSVEIGVISWLSYAVFPVLYWLKFDFNLRNIILRGCAGVVGSSMIMIPITALLGALGGCLLFFIKTHNKRIHTVAAQKRRRG